MGQPQQGAAQIAGPRGDEHNGARETVRQCRIGGNAFAGYRAAQRTFGAELVAKCGTRRTHAGKTKPQIAEPAPMKAEPAKAEPPAKKGWWQRPFSRD